uniref:Inositol monophosphatase 1 n=1 Tax=Neogobius melanostomus TaxID=47308 RepID=A0A8C6TI31_9GOBI
MAEQSHDPWQSAMDHAVAVARKAGEVQDKCSPVQTKTSAVDLVTETDQEVERLIIQSVKSKFPSHRFIGEESVSSGEPCVLTTVKADHPSSKENFGNGLNILEHFVKCGPTCLCGSLVFPRLFIHKDMFGIHV